LRIFLPLIFELCSSQFKGYADAKNFKGRIMAQLAEHICEGFYTKFARPGRCDIRGGRFMLDPGAG
jgi:phosphoketolase